MANASGTLYLVATPIGNLDDFTHRAVKLLKEADEIYCEDTRRTAILLKHYGIAKSLKSFHDHSSKHIMLEIVEGLKAGQKVAYMTDAGMPVVSDPGFVLVRAAQDNDIPVCVIPGPSAAVTLFAGSGLPTPKYFFHGFFPRTRGEVERVLELVRTLPVAHVFYEAPGRIVSSLEVFNRNLPESRVVVGRELTKVHEEIVRGTAASVYELLAARPSIKGEAVFAVFPVEPSPKQVTVQMDANTGEEIEVVELSDAQKAEIATLVKSGQSSKDVAKELAKKYGISRRVIYEFIIRGLT